MLEVGDVVSFPNQFLRVYGAAVLGSGCIAECVKVDLERGAAWGRIVYAFIALVSYSPIYELAGYNRQIGWWEPGEKFGVPDPFEKLRIDKKDLILYSYFPFKSRNIFHT
jgi:hypothetical protein